ncbi:ATP-binding protein [Leptolyngbya sp. AN02str]|uniref:sensor histidine kinase n=1 Tax=Leptolyngbya sp. AN02str TaxID=3423363 RepID=UPI003D3234E1
MPPSRPYSASSLPSHPANEKPPSAKLPPSAHPAWKQWLHQLPLGQKIIYGYAGAISMGFFGAMTGLLVADYIQGQGVFQFTDAQVQATLLSEFEQAANRAQLHGARGLALIDNPTAMQREAESLQVSLAKVEQLKRDLAAFLADDPTWIAAEEPSQITEVLERYNQQLNEQAAAIQAALTLPSPHETLHQIIEQHAERLDQSEADVLALIQVAQNQESRAANVMETAQGLEKLIIVVSMLLAGAIAGILAWRTTRTIVRPIETMTQTVQQSTQDANFDLRIPVTSHDEVGILAETFNYYMQFVKQLLTQQQTTNQQLQETLIELHQTQGKMIQSEKMSALGQMVAGIAHEINNPVNFVHGNLTYMYEYTQDLLRLLQAYQRHYPTPPHTLQADLDAIDLPFLTQDLKKIFQSMQVGSDRIREIVVSLRNFSHLDEAAYTPVNLHDGINNTLMILHHRLKASSERPEIQVIKHYGDLPLVECYGGQLNQVFMNLLSNAIDALEESNQGRSYQDITAQPNVIEIHTTITESHNARIVIADNGAGIPEEVRSRLFDPFFTTKPVGKGTGLGLSISHQIITENHNGNLWCDSTPGKGTQFVIEIPLFAPEEQ